MIDAAIGLMLKMSWQAAILAAVIFAICRLAKKAPSSWRYALWVLVLVKFVVPPFAHMPAELAFWNKANEANAPVTNYASSQDYSSSFKSRNTPAAKYVEPLIGSDTKVTSEQAVAQEPSLALSPSIMLSIAWALVAFICFGLLVLRIIRQASLHSKSERVEDGPQAILIECAAKLGIQRLPDLRESSQACTPMLIGLFKPTIILPKGVVDECPTPQLTAILLHELAHVKRWDMAVVWLYQIVQLAFFFHPALWLAGRELRRERELACDELVLSSSGITRQDYAAGYVSALKMAGAASRATLSLAMAEPFEMEKKRLHSILRLPIRKLSPLWIVGLIVICAVGLPTFVDCSSQPAINIAKENAEMLAGVKDPEATERYKFHPTDMGNTINQLVATATQKDPRDAKPARDKAASIADVDVEDLLAKARAARAEAIARIKSGKGGISISENYGKYAEHRLAFAKVAFNGNRFNYELHQSDGNISISTFDGSKLVQRLNNRVSTLGDDELHQRLLVSSLRRSFDLVGQAYPNLDAVLLYHKPNERRIAGHELIWGRDCIIIVSKHAYSSKSTEIRKIWVSAADYYVPRLEVWTMETGWARAKMMSRSHAHFKKYGSDWLPDAYAHVEYSLTAKGSPLKWRANYVYSKDFAVNVPVTDAELNLPNDRIASAHLSPAKTLPDIVGYRRDLPCEGRITKAFGYRKHPITGVKKLHDGIDINAPNGTPIHAMADGVVIKAGLQGAHGNTVIIGHGGGVSTIYSQCESLAVSAGQKVRRGDIIAYVGHTGYATGPHCHYGKYQDGKPVNPI